jgi:Dolichyl-phosphate-mannose-protein mannosyltransferase
MQITSTTASTSFFCPFGWIIYIGLSLSLFIAAVLAFTFLNDYQNWGDDWAQYMLQAKAVLAGDLRDCIQQNAFMMRESALKPGPVAYPWGFPVLLALEGSLFSFDLQVFKVFNILIFLLLIVAIFWLARRFLTDAEALAAACMFAFNPVLLHYCNHILTELPFTLTSVCAFIAMEKPASDRRSLIRSRLVIGAFAFAAFTLRINGILVLAAATVKAFLSSPIAKRRRWPTLTAMIFSYIMFLLLYTIWCFFFPSGGEDYLQELRNVSVDNLITNGLSYPVSLFDFFTGGHYSSVIAVLLGPLVLLGAVKNWRRTNHFSAYVILTLALYFIWPGGQGYRYMIPLTPFLVILMMLGLDACARGKMAGGLGMLARLVQFAIPILFLVVASVLVVTDKLPRQKWNPYD